MEIITKDIVLSIINDAEEKILFENYTFPQDFVFEKILPSHIEKDIIFSNCDFLRIVELDGFELAGSVKFIKCDIPALRLANLQTSGNLIFQNCNSKGFLHIENVIGNVSIEILNCLLSKLRIKYVQHLKGIALDNWHGTSYVPDIKLEDCNIRGDSSFFLNTDRIKSVVFDRVKFSANTAFTFIGSNKGNYISFNNCAMDNLFLKEYSKYNFERLEFENPGLNSDKREIARKFKKVDDKDINSLVLFARAAKERFRDTVHRTLYDLYYIVDQRYSRKLPSYGWLNGIVNWCSDFFSLYGYSIWRPFIGLFVLFWVFQFVYFAIEHYTGNPLYFWQIANHHLSQLTFFRSADGWFKSGSLQRVLFIFEGILFIALLTGFVLAIRKLFKRT